MYIPTNQEQLKVIAYKNPSTFLRRLNDWGCLKPLPLVLFFLAHFPFVHDSN